MPVYKDSQASPDLFHFRRQLCRHFRDADADSRESIDSRSASRGRDTCGWPYRARRDSPRPSAASSTTTSAPPARGVRGHRHWWDRPYRRLPDLASHGTVLAGRTSSAHHYYHCNPSGHSGTPSPAVGAAPVHWRICRRHATGDHSFSAEYVHRGNSSVGCTLSGWQWDEQGRWAA